jgi:hypothetical protein
MKATDEFLKHHDKYAPGAVAGFDEEYAEALCKAGIAKPYEKPTDKKSKPTAGEGQ